MQENPVSLSKTKTDFTATADIVCDPPFISPGTIKILPNGKKLVRGVKVKYDMIASDPLLTGQLFWTTNKNIEVGGYKVKLWGKQELIVALGKGKWELTWHGYKIGSKITLYATGVGVDGDVKGMVTKWVMNLNHTTVHCNKIFHSIVGYILK
jgi:hypothetical protein